LTKPINKSRKRQKGQGDKKCQKRYVGPVSREKDQKKKRQTGGGGGGGARQEAEMLREIALSKKSEKQHVGEPGQGEGNKLRPTIRYCRKKKGASVRRKMNNGRR